MIRCPNKSKRVAAQCYFADGHDGHCSFDRGERPATITLAETRMHIELLVNAHRRAREQGVVMYDVSVAIDQLTEILAMLDRVQTQECNSSESDDLSKLLNAEKVRLKTQGKDGGT